MKIENRVIALFLLIAVIGFSFSTPRMAGPDEPAHQATAWNLEREPLGGALRKALVPDFVNEGACFAFKPHEDASCIDSIVLNGGLVRGLIVNYPTLYYYTVYIGQKAFSFFDLTLIATGGRISSILAIAIALLFALWAFRRNQIPLLRVLMATLTPTWIFFSIVVNPSGLELMAIFIYGGFLALICRGISISPNLSNQKDRRYLLVLACLALVAAAARSISAVWVALILLLALALHRSSPLTKAGWLRVIVAHIPAFIFFVIWNLTHQLTNHDGSSVAFGSSLNLRNLLEIFKDFPVRSLQMLGILGWLDTQMPNLLFAVLVLTWTVVYLRLTPKSARAILIGSLILSVVAVPSILEWLAYVSIGPFWWQGRYTLPVLLGILAFSLVFFRGYEKRPLKYLVVVNSWSVTLMLMMNSFRYNFGVGEFFPVRFGQPALGAISFAISILAVIALAGFSLWFTSSRYEIAPERE